MNVRSINECLIHGRLEEPGLFPHLEHLARSPYVFEFDFGLDELPREPGILLIRGARQYGKSTWLEARLRETVETEGPGSAFYLNGDVLRNEDALVDAVSDLVPLFREDAPVRRLFVDEITAVRNWERGIKRLADAGDLRDVLVVTTGSRATDLRRGAERLPGRKGKLTRTTYLFAPIPFREFERVCGAEFRETATIGYLLSGGCPIAAAELAGNARLPEYVIEMIRD